MLDSTVSCWLAGAVASFVVGGAISPREGMPRRRAVAGLLLLGLAIVVGARLHAMVLEEGRSVVEIVSHPNAWLRGTMRLPGGLLLATALAPLVAALLRLEYGRLSDVAITSGAAFLAVGRIGCHFAGCCFGVPTTLPWGTSYPRGTSPWGAHVNSGLVGRDAAGSLPVHPFALYLALVAAVVCVLLIWLGARGARPGTRTIVGLVALGLAFGALESVRDVPIGTPPMFRQELWLLLGSAAACAGIVVTLLRSRGWLRQVRFGRVVSN